LATTAVDMKSKTPDGPVHCSQECAPHSDDRSFGGEGDEAAVARSTTAKEISERIEAAKNRGRAGMALYDSPLFAVVCLCHDVSTRDNTP
jgi:hypothetical protein